MSLLIASKQLKKILLKSLILVLILGLVLPYNVKASTQTDLLDHWVWRNPLPTGNELNDVVYGSNKYVAVGDKGTVITSTDGVNWSSGDLGYENKLNAIAYGNGRFVAVGEGIILASPDGETWHKYNSISSIVNGYTYHYEDVAYGNGRFIIVGYGDNSTNQIQTILTSTDGLNWSTKLISKELFGITYGNNQFVAVGSNKGTSNAAILRSTDGENWVSQESNTYATLKGIAYGNDVYVAVGDGGTVTSEDGVTWNYSNDSTYLSDVIFGQGKFVAVGLLGISTSTDGVEWTKQEYSQGNAIAYGNGKFISVANDGGIYLSSDGLNWNSYNKPRETMFNNLVFGNGTFVAVAKAGEIFTSDNGTVWEKQESGTTEYIHDVIYANNKFVAVGGKGTIITSTDGTVWTKRASGSSKPLTGIAYGNNIFVTVGTESTILTSTDGIHWTSRSLGASNNLLSITYGNHKFVIGGSQGKIFRSSDGLNWSSSSLGSNYYFLDVAYGNNKYVALDVNQSIFVSTDAISWSKKIMNENLYRITYGDNTFVGVGKDGAIMTSTDTITWNKKRTITSNNLMGIAYGNHTFVAVGDKETIIQSLPLSNIDIMEPIWPYHANIDILNLSDTEFAIEWTEAEDNVEVTGYIINIYKGDILIDSIESVNNLLNKSGLVKNTAYTIEINAVDNVGNISLPLTRIITTLENAVPKVVRANPASGSFNSPIAVNLTASVPVTIYYTLDGSIPTTNSLRYTGPIPIQSEGTTTLKYMSIDLVGNQSAISTEKYTIDTVSPVVTANPQSGTYNTLQSIQLTASEAANIYYTLNGVIPTTNSTKYTEPFHIGTEGRTVLKYMAIDNAGNHSSVYTQIYTIVPVDIQTNINLEGIIGKNSWYTSNVKVTLTAIDKYGNSITNDSLVIEYSLDGEYWYQYNRPILLTKEGVRSFYYRSKDSNNYTEGINQRIIKIDKTLPMIDIDSPKEGKSYQIGVIEKAKWKATDKISGIDVVTATVQNGEELATNTLGQKSFTVTATDKAGNKAVKTVTYKVVEDATESTEIEIIPPLRDGTNVFKKGRVIPVKFKVTNGQYLETEPKLYLQKMDDDEVVKEIEAVTVGNGKKGNKFKFDKKDKQYSYNLSTKELSKGKWRLKIDLGNGEYKYVTIILK